MSTYNVRFVGAPASMGSSINGLNNYGDAVGNLDDGTNNPLAAWLHDSRSKPNIANVDGRGFARVNDRGEYVDGRGGVVRDLQENTIVDLSVALGRQVLLVHITNDRLVVGWAKDRSQGLVYDLKSLQALWIDPPPGFDSAGVSAASTVAGLAVGWYANAGGPTRGFRYFLSGERQG